MNIEIGKSIRLTGLTPAMREKLVEELTMVNPKWLENERMGRWNRNTPKVLRLYSKWKDSLWIPRGYMRRLLMLCRENKVEAQIKDQRRELSKTDFEFSGSLKNFQAAAVKKMLTKEFGTLSAPTGSGKTVMALYMIAARNQPTLIIVHTKELAFQWIAAIEKFMGIGESEVGLIGSGRHTVGEKITVALVQSLYRCADEISEGVGHLVVDECHRAPSRTFTEAVTEFDSKYMLGLSATPWRRDKLSKLIFWHLGDVHWEIEKSQLVEEGHILRAEVVFRETSFDPYHDPVKHYSKMLLELTTDDDRNRLIVSDVAKESTVSRGVCLVLSDRKKHCETLKAMLKYKHNVQADLLTGDLSNEERRHVLQRLNNGEVKVLIATGQLVGEGFDCKALSTLFLATPIRFSGRLIQYLGRVLRPDQDKKQARVFDYVDSSVDVLKAAARQRQRVYSED
ncbi:MAG: DEAD/DEAH box helicase [Thermodesulfobacteriota bacterium]